MIDRCRHSADFVALRRGKRTGGRVLWMLFAPDDALPRARVAFAIGRRSGAAVHRNRLRRRVQSLLREHAQQLPPGRYLIGARTQAREVSYAEARDDVLHFLARVSA